jgi:hypothetical protein
MEDSSRGASSSRQHTLDADGLPSLLVIENEIKLNKKEKKSNLCALVVRLYRERSLAEGVEQ